MTELTALIDIFRERLPALGALGHSVLFELDDADGAILLESADGKASVQEVPAATQAETVLRLSSKNLEKLARGRLSPMLAFSTGRLRVKGSMGVALKLASLLDAE